MTASGAVERPGPEPANGWILYDGECGFCIRMIRNWRATLERHGYGVDRLQAPWVAAALHMPLEELLHDMRLLKPCGTLVSGADVYFDAMRHIWWAWPSYCILRLPGLNALARAGYRWFARNRYCVSGQCRIHP